MNFFNRKKLFKILSNISVHLDTLPRSDTASYTSMNSPIPSSVTINGDDENGSIKFHINFNELILQIHKRSLPYIIDGRAQH